MNLDEGNLLSNFEKEDQFKSQKQSQEETVQYLKSEIKELKFLSENGGKGFKNTEEMKKELSKNLNIGIDNEEANQLKKDNSSMKQSLIEKSREIIQLKTKMEGQIRSYECELKSIKGNFSRLDAQYRIAYKNFSLRDSEYSKLKEESKLIAQEKNRGFSELVDLKHTIFKLQKENSQVKRENTRIIKKNDELRECLEDNPSTQESQKKEIEFLKRNNLFDSNNTKKGRNQKSDKEKDLNSMDIESDMNLNQQYYLNIEDLSYLI